MVSLSASLKPDLPNIQVFDTSGTWIKPLGCKNVIAYIFGAGGGGGSGRSNTSGTARGAGGSGAGGSTTIAELLADNLSDQVEVIVGVGGTGGAATTAIGDGFGGQAGGDSKFGSFTASGGGGGGPGTSNIAQFSGGGTAGVPGAVGTFPGGAGIRGGDAVGASPATQYSASGGGQGQGSINSTGAPSAAKNGAGPILATGVLSQGNGPSFFIPRAPTSLISPSIGGQGGIEPGPGNVPGGGGGGSSYGTDTAFSKAGGNGANGRVVVISW